MPSIRDIRRKARLDLHQHMRVQALYIVPNADPVPLHVRVHTKFMANAIEGGVRSGNGKMVDRQELEPSLIFWRAELAAANLRPIKNAIISVEAGEAYRLNNAEAPDDSTVRWYVTAITNQTDLAGLPVPGGA